MNEQAVGSCGGAKSRRFAPPLAGKRKDGAARMCIGVGQGIVMVVEKPL